MRNGVIQVITFLIHKAFQPQDSDEMNNMSSAAINTRDSLLHVLLERFYDVNAFARSKVVQSWSYLCQHRAIPLKLFSAVTERAVGRLEDKAAHVRKNAIQLLTFLLQFNPYSAQLSYSSFEQNLKRVDNLISDKMGKTAEELLEQRDETTELDPEDDKHLKAYCYYRDALQFISEIHKAIPIICELLGSKNSSDVLEAIQFFVTVQRFNMERAKEGLRKMLMLAWSKESNIRDALLKAYVELYLTPPDMDFPNKRLGHLYIAKNLIGLTIGATPGELTSLEELLTNLMQAKHIPGQVINLLWDIFAQKSEESSAAEGRGALIILSMLANADPTIVSSKLSLLVNVGLGPRAYHDPVLAKWVCIALQKLSNSSLTKQKWDNVNNENAKENSPEENDEQYKPGNRFRANHPLFEKLAQLVKDEAAAIPIMKWFSATEQALNTIYSISENPDQLAAKIVRDMAKTALTCLERQINQNSDGVAKQDNSTETLETKNMNPNNNFQNDSAILGLARLFFVVGHVALKQLVYIEEIYKELERRCEKKRGEKKPSPNSHQPSINETRSRKSILMDYRKFKKQRQSQFDIDAKDTGLEVKSGEEQELIEKELGHVGNTIDAEIEAARVSVEKGIVHQNLLGQFGPLLVKVCANAEGHFCHPLLRASAVLALLKFMTVSAEFCEQNLQLLFTILLKDDKDGHNSLLRANIVIALGDLAFRFPNLVEPWTHHIYSRLRDPDARVRKNTLMVLTHLILNDMIKIKGQISEMALCLEDKEPRIADLARLFFHELSCKGNTIYNVLPDAISGLSAAIKETSSDSFKNIMKYLFSFIEKDKQVDSLVEKLCHRFSMSNESKQWRDIAYCLTLLNYTEKSFKKLSDLFKFYKDAIADETVYESLLAIATKVHNQKLVLFCMSADGPLISGTKVCETRIKSRNRRIRSKSNKLLQCSQRKQ
jgi:condensin complex subunit 1